MWVWSMSVSWGKSNFSPQVPANQSWPRQALKPFLEASVYMSSWNSSLLMRATPLNNFEKFLHHLMSSLTTSDITDRFTPFDSMNLYRSYNLLQNVRPPLTQWEQCARSPVRLSSSFLLMNLASLYLSSNTLRRSNLSVGILSSISSESMMMPKYWTDFEGGVTLCHDT